MDSMEVAPEGYRSGRVYIDVTQDTPSIPAFVHATERWNGWAIPLFTRETLIAEADALRAHFPEWNASEPEGMRLTFGADGFPSIIDNQYPDDGSIVAEVIIDGRTFYDIGGRGFTWMDDERGTSGDEPGFALDTSEHADVTPGEQLLRSHATGEVESFEARLGVEYHHEHLAYWVSVEDIEGNTNGLWIESGEFLRMCQRMLG